MIPLGVVVGRHAPRQIVVQMTDHCNALCPQCEMRATNRYPRREAEFHTLVRVVEHAAHLDVQAISFTGGEPFLHRRMLLALIRLASQAGITYTRTGTNGFLFSCSESPNFERRMHDLGRDLHASGLRNLWISLDSADPDVHENRRGHPGVVRGIEAALPILAEHGVYPTANLGINRMMGLRPLERFDERDPSRFAESVRKAASQFLRRVGDMGFTMANFCYPMSRGAEAGERPGGMLDVPATATGLEGLVPVYQAISTDDAVTFSSQEKAVLYRALKDAIAAARTSIRVFTPLSSLEALAQDHEGAHDERSRGHVSFGCLGGVGYFYVSPVGLAYPCGYRGGDELGPFWKMGPGSSPRRAECRACDWECFRDPSQLFGQFHALRRRPLQRGLRARHRELLALWLGDVRYALACGLFDGRRPLERRNQKPHRSSRRGREAQRHQAPYAGDLPADP